jgi:hypothetical protein
MCNYVFYVLYVVNKNIVEPSTKIMFICFNGRITPAAR